MTTTRRRRIVIWVAGALLLAFSSYMSAYYLTAVRTTQIHSTNEGMIVAAVAAYQLPPPIPAHYNSPAVYDHFPVLFAPAHWIDRQVRSAMWPEPFFVHSHAVGSSVGLE